MTDPRYSRYSRVLDPALIMDEWAFVVGCGGVGRQVGLLLGAMGLEVVDLVDPDTVSEENLGNQGWRAADVQRAKVWALAEEMRARKPSITVNQWWMPWEKWFSRQRQMLARSHVLFVAVDSIDTRRNIFLDWMKSGPVAGGLLIDGRMGAMTGQVFVAQAGEAQGEAYERTLFAMEEAHKGDCTRQNTLYCGTLVASMMVSQWASVRGGKGLVHPFTGINCQTLEVWHDKAPSRGGGG